MIERKKMVDADAQDCRDLPTYSLSRLIVKVVV